MKPAKLHRIFYILMALCLLLPQWVSFGAPQTQSQRAGTVLPQDGPTEPPLVIRPSKDNREGDGGLPDDPFGRADWFYGQRTAGDPSLNFTIANAAKLRSQAADQVIQEKGQNQPNNSIPYGGNWSAFGPNPIVQATRSGGPLAAMSGRIGALAIASTYPYTMYLGAAQGGIWISSTITNTWTPVSDQVQSLAIGAIALAPSNENIVYVGTGEGALSGDSYFGNGVLKSTDGGKTFNQVSGDYFQQVSISKIAVDPTNPNHLYVATLRGRGGSLRVTPPFPTPYGIWESNDSGVTWTAKLTTNDQYIGATDLVMDPQNPDALYASFWGQGIVKTTDGGTTWNSAMHGLPTGADYTVAPTRFALGISHPVSDTNATLYTGFEWYDTSGNYHSSTVWKSIDNGASWNETNTDVVGGYCGSPSGSQCFYDNVIGVDPKDPNIVFALGLFNYDTGTGGVFRSMDGGDSWVDLGWEQHPDFHAIAFRADDPSHVMIGNDGGVWYSTDYGGRVNPNDPPDAVDWQNLNGHVNPTNALDVSSNGLQITQFTSAVNNPVDPTQAYGGAQDNGTSHKFDFNDQAWYDLTSGDGGHILVDPVNPNYVYGTFYGIQPYRFDDGMSDFFTNQSIYNGLNRGDRSAFYIPFVMDPEYPNRLYLGTYRVYRTDNRGDLWQAISPDLTTGCTSGSASPTTFECVVTAFGPTAGAPALYVGTGDGNLMLTTDATVVTPTWKNVRKPALPVRPVSAFAVDRSDYRLAYVAYNGFNAATPLTPGHVFKTTDGGQTWTNISGDLPDVPVNTLVLSPTDPNTLYAGTDVGPMVTIDGGAHWTTMGSGFPIVAVTSLDLNAYTGQMLAATHGRGAWVITDTNKTPALQIRTRDAGVPVGPGSLLTYRITVKNAGNANATGVVISDTIPAHTSFVSASGGGAPTGNTVVWNVGTVMSGTVNANDGLDVGSQTVTMTVRIDSGMANGSTITNENFSTKSSEGPGATGSPFLLILAPTYDLRLIPASQTGGKHPGSVIRYTESIQNLGYNDDVFTLATSGNQWPTTLWDSSFSTQITSTSSIPPGATADFGVEVSVPATATSGMTDSASVEAASKGNPARTASASIQTIVVTKPVLLVDNDGNGPDVQSYYRAALDANGYQYDVWDLSIDPNLPPKYLDAHDAVVWFTGSSYPGPILPYESELASFLDHGGKLFMSGQDILDRAAGTTAFVHDYLHIDWDGTDAQNDIGTTSVTAVVTNTVMAGLGTYAMDYASVGLYDYSDEITPISPAIPAFLDDSNMTDALTVSDGTYKVMFLAFPFEAMGTAQDRAEVLMHTMDYFGIKGGKYINMPLIFK